MAPFLSLSSNQQRPEPYNEERWRAFTYLQYLGGLDRETFDWSLRFAQTCKFAWTLLPAGFEIFEGRTAALGIDRLGLSESATRELLLAIADEGARVPGTAQVLRVARPWCALFEPAAGDESILPAHWLEGLELYGDPDSTWIGRRVKARPICPAFPGDNSESARQAMKQFGELDASLYETTRFGWRLRESSPLPRGFID